MKVRCLLSIVFFLFIASAASAQFCVPAEAEAFYSNATREINPKYIRWVQSVATDIRSGKTNIEDVHGMATTYAEPGKLGDGDIMALAFLVMMEAARSAQEDLKSIMEDVKRSNDKKKAWREAINLINNKVATQKYLLRADYDSLRKGMPISPAPARADAVNSKTTMVSVAEIDSLLDILRDERDSLSEQGEEQQLKMQMYMDRMTKANTMASNMIKKFSETASTIIQNLK